ncbi:methyl-accepting chemotaxis protein [Halomonas sp. HP20-15]|uniref:methyl-accepting chemotaxis protein n=1 Tax=Halomonas sp. HP20-15 TaxID=3085901 RepID=UPI0029811C78|nr:methyl-accepting chemotaxis protein [Halomonas sp. HP20-15]MDW5376594.1 methyl-accepting chemotaxis protein [Halomonas sp. HP20-15]
MLSRFKIGTRLGVAFGLVLVLLLGTLAAGVLGLNSIKKTANHALNNDIALGNNSAKVQQLALEERRYEKDTFINIDNAEKTASYFDKWEKSQKALSMTLVEGNKLAKQEEIKTLYSEAGKALEDYAKGFRAVYKEIASEEIQDTVQANAVFSQYKDDIYRLEDLAAKIDKAVAERVALAGSSIDQQYQAAFWSLLGFAVVALLLAVLLAYVITRSISRPLYRAVNVAQRVAQGDLTSRIDTNGKDEISLLFVALYEMQENLNGLVRELRRSSDGVFNGSNEIALGSQDLAARTESQAASLQETASSMEEMASTVRQNTDSAQEADRLSANAADAAEVGGSEVKRTTQLMETIAESSRQVTEVVSIIDSIAFQTNILALNASVEAARAGEQGRGFAVVAQEVRSLASRSAESAKAIRDMVESTMQEIVKGVAQAKRSGETIESSVMAIRQVSNLMKEISTATREQNSGIEQINVALTQLDSATQQNASLVEETSQAAASLKGQAETMADMIAKFRTNDQGESQKAVAASIVPVRAEASSLPAPRKADKVAEVEEWATF